MKNLFNIPENISEEAKKELEKLLKGNQNFVNGQPTLKNICPETLRKYAFHQEPYACVLTCSDSRVVPEIIFDCGIGEIFVVRVAGMTTGPNIIESVEYAVKCLKVPVVILLGHDDCGEEGPAWDRLRHRRKERIRSYPDITGPHRFGCRCRTNPVWNF